MGNETYSSAVTGMLLGDGRGSSDSETPSSANRPTNDAQDTYTWSWTRVREQITINVASTVLSVVTLALLAALLATLGSTCVLLLQHFAAFVVVPTQVLQAIALVGFCTILAALLLVLAAYAYFQYQMRHNPAFAGMVAGATLGALIGLFLATRGIDKEKAWAATQSKPHEPAHTTSGSHADWH